jgi:hypothetical protein
MCAVIYPPPNTHFLFGLLFLPLEKNLEKMKKRQWNIKRPSSPERGFVYWISFAFVTNWKEMEKQKKIVIFHKIFYV